MKRTLWTIGLLLTFVLSAWGADPPVMPWRTFSGEMAQAAKNPQMGACSGGEIYVAFIPYQTAHYIMVFAPATNRIAFCVPAIATTNS